MNLLMTSVCLLAATSVILAADAPATQPGSQPSTIYDFTLNDIDGNPAPLAQYKGKTLLIVNVASKCGYTKQYADLEKLYEQYKDKGLVILGFPANNFLSQEPGTDLEIKQFCTSKYNVTFPMFSKISVKGKDIHPLYQFLTTHSNPSGDIGWNFEKFVVAPNGMIAGRFKSKVTPLSDELTQTIQASLAKQ